MRSLVLDDGSHIRLMRRLPGRSHRVYLGRESGTARLVVVKTAGNIDALRQEADALKWLSASGAPVPQSSGMQTTHRHRPVLVIEHIRGHRLQSVADFAAAGRALALIHAVKPPSHIRPTPALPHLAIQAILSAGEPIARSAAVDVARLAPRLAAATPASVSFVHGDASMSNVLIKPRGSAVVFDPENAQLGHPGLDVGRFLFLAAQSPAVTRDMLAGFVAGYGQPPLYFGDLYDWIAIAGLQIAVWRASHPQWGLSAMDALVQVAGYLHSRRIDAFEA